MAEVKRRQRDSLQSTAKRRSIATCSTRDKEMEGIALESALQNVLTSNVSRRRPGRPISTLESPTGGSPKSGSLSEINSQATPPTPYLMRGGSIRVREMGRKEWNSAAELTINSSQMKYQSNVDDNKKGGAPHEEEMKTSIKEDSRKFTRPAKMATNISSSVRSCSSTTGVSEEDQQDNNEEEAQKLREASKKVLRFQNSRGSVSSGEYSLENQKSPVVGPTLPRQRTFDEDTERYLGDPNNEDLVRTLFNLQHSPKICNLGRRHTVSTPKVPKTEEEDNLWAQLPVRTPNPVERKKALPSEGTKHNPSTQIFDFADVSQSKTQSPGAQDQNAASAEKKSVPNVSSIHAPDQVLEGQNQEGKPVESTGNQLQRNSENIPPKNTWIKTESPGLFFSFFKRLGDMSKLQNSKETVHKSTNSGV